MALTKGHLTYQANSILNSKPEELNLMLYNGLVRFLMQAMKSIDDKDISKAHENIVKAENIIMEFYATLDPEYEISKSLGLLYDYMYRQLVEANFQKNRKIVAEVLGYATELRDTWAQAVKSAKEQPVQQLRQAK